MDTNAILDLFCSSSFWAAKLDIWEIDRVTPYLDAGAICVAQEQYVWHARPQVCFDAEGHMLPEAIPWARAIRGRGSLEHAELKYQAYHWLMEKGEPEPWCELHEYDVVGLKVGCVVECGDSRPSRMLDVLSDERFNAFALMPYPCHWNADIDDFDDHVIWVLTLADGVKKESLNPPAGNSSAYISRRIYTPAV